MITIGRFSILILVLGLALSAFLVAGSLGPSSANDSGPPVVFAIDDGDEVVSIVTVRSAVDPFAGHEQHQLVVLLLDTSGRVFTGTLSYTSTKPLEVVVLFPYDPPGPPSSSHGELATVDIEGQLYSFTVIPTGKAGTLPFSGAGLALHTSNGRPFEATASIRANVEDQTAAD